MRAKRRQVFQEQTYRVYVGEALKNISENVANGFGREGATYMAMTYAEVIESVNTPVKSADEVIARIKQKLKEYE